jgi:hypothetical protein
MKLLMKDMPKVNDLMDAMAPTDAEKQDKSMVESINKLHAEALKVFAACWAMIRQNKAKTYCIIWGQCSSAPQFKLMGKTEYLPMSTSFNCVWLLQTLNLLSAGVDKNYNVYVSTFHPMETFYNMRQLPTETMEMYHGCFESAVATATLSERNLLDTTNCPPTSVIKVTSHTPTTP